MNASLRRWTLNEEATLVRMRRENACAKTISRKLDRTPESIGQHVHKMKSRAPRFLEQWRAEEIALLERLLDEAQLRSDLA